jgi:hypothetical protein
MLTGLTELEKIGIIVGIIIAVIPILDFIFGDDFQFPEWARISFGVAAIGIPSGIIIIPRIKRIGIRSPFFDKRKQIRQPEIPVVPPVIVYSHDDLPAWSELFEQTEHEIMIHGITLESLNHVRTSIEAAAKQDKKVRVLVCNTDTPFMDGIEKLVVSTSTTNRIQSAVDMLYQTRSSLGSNDMRNLEIKWHREIPTMSLVILDEVMQIEAYPYKTPQDKRKIFKIYRKDHMELFEVYRKAFGNLWDDASLAQTSTPR